MNMNHHNTLSVLAKALLSAGIFGGLALPAVQAASYRTDLHDFFGGDRETFFYKDRNDNYQLGNKANSSVDSVTSKDGLVIVDVGSKLEAYDGKGWVWAQSTDISPYNLQVNFHDDVTLDGAETSNNPALEIGECSTHTCVRNKVAVYMDQGKTFSLKGKNNTYNNKGLFDLDNTEFSLTGGALRLEMTGVREPSDYNSVMEITNTSELSVANESVEIYYSGAAGAWEDWSSYAVRVEGDSSAAFQTGNFKISHAPSATEFTYGISTNGKTSITAADEINISAKYAVYANGANASAQLTASKISLDGSSYSIYANTATKVTINAHQVNVSSHARARNGAEIRVNADQINWGVDKEFNEWAAQATEAGSKLEINGEKAAGHIVNTSGYMKAASGGNITIRSGANSELNHRSVLEDGGIFTLELAESAVWHMPHNNQLTTLDFQGGGKIDFDHEYNWNSDAPTFKTLTTESLKGNNGTIAFRVDLAANGNDKVQVGNAEGTHFAVVDFHNSSLLEDSITQSDWLVSQTSGDMTLTAANGGNVFHEAGGLSAWELIFVADGNETALDTEEGRESLTNHGTGAGQWHLIRGDDSEIAPEIVDNLTIGTSTAQALAYLADLEDLRKRIGEVRYGAQAGVWAKAFSKQDRVESSVGRGFKQEAYGINVGADTLVGTTESSSWLLGGAFRYSRADQEGLAAGGLATGDLSEYSIKAYATWMHEKGSYADIVLQAGRYEQDLHGLDNTGTGSSKADYNTWGFGASVEVGHMFSLTDGADDRAWFNHWFIEPQLELSYFYAKGESYSTSTGLAVDQDNADFLTGRAGLVIGKKFSYGSVDDLDRRYFQIAVIGGVRHEFLGGDQTIHYTGVDRVRKNARAEDIAGTRVYYGLNFDWQVADDWRVFAQFDREEGDGYTKDYDFSIGLKYAF